MSHGESRFDRLLLYGTGAFCLAAMCIFVLWPVAEIFWRSLQGSQGSLSFEHYRSFFQEPRTLRALWRSLYVSVMSTLIAVTLAFLYAYALSRTRVPLRPLWFTIALLPLIAPSFVQALAFIFLFGRNGFITRELLGLRWDGIFGATGIICSEVFYVFPQAFLILYATLRAGDASLEEAAQSLGHSSWSTFWHVTLPGARYGIAAAAFLVFSLVITDFGNPAAIGGDYQVLATEIYRQFIGLSDFPMASAVSMVLLIPALLAFVMDRYFSRQTFGSISGRARPYSGRLRWSSQALFTSFVIAISAAIVLIYGTLVAASLVHAWGYEYRFSLQHYQFPTVGGLSPVWTSLKVAVISALTGATITFLVAFLVVRGIFARLLSFAIFLPAAIPGLVLGIGYIFAFNTAPLQLTGTASILVVANMVHFLTFAVLVHLANLRQLDASVSEAARSLGAGVTRTIAWVIFPLNWQSFLAAISYLFIQSMVTISAVIFLVSPHVRLASVSILQLLNEGRTQSAAAMSVLLVVVIMAVLGMLQALNWLGRRMMRQKSSSPKYCVA
ncbi:ABC transporter permease subunit [Desulfurispirillum indicum]|uniref:ABC transporter permease subunit n=1 Tax=Desulfurispirillum indicum TaxID=936456 RepID=UPI001CFBDECE|nr:ABC transporter permease subunit [Desulfurispirillum indicum]UCZ56200.1 ABC transporter permease subunit [Desulfurispirillum indicum]